MNSEIRKPVTRASATSSGKRKRSGSEDTDTLKSSTTRQNDGKTGKQLTGQICGRCQELKIPVNLAQDGTVLTVPSSRGEVVMGQHHHKIWHVPCLEGENGKAKLQRLLFDIDFPFTKDCTVCEYLAEILEHGFEFRPFSDEDIHALGLPKSECKDNWIVFRYTGAGFQLYCSKKLDAFGSCGMSRYPHGKQYWIGDKFGIATNADISLDQPARLLSCRELQTSGPDYSLLLGWLNNCHQQHDTCKTLNSDGLHSIRLIDIKSRSIVPYPTDCHVDYIALSYVWGGISPKSFGPGPLPEKLPSTIEDAIEVTRQLKMLYLWVDYVCIDQGDPVHKETQISLMDDIYSCAFATIISLNGESANDGIPRVGANDQGIPQATVHCGGENKIISKMPPLERQLRHSTWATRGWTFQEGILSHRRLIFTRHQVYFSCNTLNCSESIGNLDSTDTTINVSRGLCDAALQNPLAQGSKSLMSLIEVYGHIISSCANRKLSDQSDALNTVLGILKMLKRLYFPEGFYYGLPQAYFRHALLWRRGMKYQFEGHHHSFTRRADFPSWSVAGWQWNVPISWFWTEDFWWCHIPQPSIRIWTQARDSINHLNARCSCSPASKSGHVLEPLLTKIETTFRSLFLSEEDIRGHSSHSVLPSGYLTIEGILVELEIVLSAQDVEDVRVADNIAEARAKDYLPYVVNLTAACSASLGSAEAFIHFDRPWRLVLSEGISKRVDLLLVAMKQSFLPFSRGLGLSLLLLEWEDGVAYRAGEVDLHVTKFDEFNLEAAKPRLQRFILG